MGLDIRNLMIVANGALMPNQTGLQLGAHSYEKAKVDPMPYIQDLTLAGAVGGLHRLFYAWGPAKCAFLMTFSFRGSFLPRMGM